MKKRYLTLILITLCIISLLLGAKSINIADILTGHDESMHLMMVSRIPRLISTLVAGSAMSICGLIMQQISQNKFVSPTTGATIDSAKLGIVIAMVLVPGATTMQKAMISFVFALAGTMLFMTFLKNLKVKSVIFVPLVGIMFGNIIGSITTYIGYEFDIMQNVNSWLQGNFSMILKGNYELLYLSIPLMAIASLYKGDNVHENILDTALFGAIFVLFCDILARVFVYPYELSVGLTVGVIGSGMFLYLVLRRKSYAS